MAPTARTRARTVREFCEQILCSPDLESKLAPPHPDLTDEDRAALRPPTRPERAPELRMGSGTGPLPKASALRDPSARAICLARFAHHELMTVELFAWALLRWPDAPAALRAGWLRVLGEEQTHCRLYLGRLDALGSRLGDHAPHSDYFWKQRATIEASPEGPRAFLAAMGLTLEQANLDFASSYASALEEAGDDASASVCRRVYEDEIGHVRLAAHWLASLAGEPDLWSAYRAAVPFPLSAARAKGRRFDSEARRRARLPESFIEQVRRARPPPRLGDPSGST